MRALRSGNFRRSSQGAGKEFVALSDLNQAAGLVTTWNSLPHPALHNLVEDLWTLQRPSRMEENIFSEVCRSRVGFFEAP
jgi:hypothetical protein